MYCGGTFSLSSPEANTTEIEQITETLCINGMFYKCTFTDTPGLAHRIMPILGGSIREAIRSVDKLNLVMFVFRHGDITAEDYRNFSDLFNNTKHLSASVITCCDDLNDDQDDEVVKEFTSDPHAKHFSTELCMRVYPIGFPDISRMDGVMQELCTKYIQKNVQKLYQLIEMSSDVVSANDILKDQTCSIM